MNSSATCQLSDAAWIEQTTPPYGNETVAFYYAVNNSGNYSMWYYCNDSSHDVNNTFWFYVESWKINATDYYNGSSLLKFNATIPGRGSFNTTDGLLETDIPMNYASVFNVTLTADDYISRTYTSQPTNQTLTAELWQYALTLHVMDSVSNSSVASFNITALYRNFTGTAGVAYLYMTAGNHTVNITASAYADYTLNITAIVGTTENMTIYLEPYITISIRREKTDLPFRTNLTQQTKVFFYCPSATIEQEFNVSINENSINIPVACAWDFIKLDVIYNDTSYFRTLIPAYDERDITFYALDLTGDLGVQIILRLNDLVGDYSQGRVMISRPISGTEQYMIQQLWDMESKATLYLLKDAYYTVRIINNDGTIIRSLGSLIADAAEEKIITVPELQFTPDKVLGTNITYGWQDTSTTIRLVYNDTTGTTTRVVFTIFYSENMSIAYQTTELNPTTVSFSFLAGNASFLACFNTSNLYPNYMASECRIFMGTRDSALGDFAGWDPAAIAKLLTWAATFVVVAMLLMFSPAPEWALAIAAVLMWFFMKINWLTYGSSYTDGVLLMLFALLAIFTFIKKVFWK